MNVCSLMTDVAFSMTSAVVAPVTATQTLPMRERRSCGLRVGTESQFSTMRGILQTDPTAMQMLEVGCWLDVDDAVSSTFLASYTGRRIGKGPVSD